MRVRVSTVAQSVLCSREDLLILSGAVIKIPLVHHFTLLNARIIQSQSVHMYIILRGRIIQLRMYNIYYTTICKSIIQAVYDRRIQRLYNNISFDSDGRSERSFGLIDPLF